MPSWKTFCKNWQIFNFSSSTSESPACRLIKKKLGVFWRSEKSNHFTTISVSNEYTLDVTFHLMSYDRQYLAPHQLDVSPINFNYFSILSKHTVCLLIDILSQRYFRVIFILFSFLFFHLFFVVIVVFVVVISIGGRIENKNSLRLLILMIEFGVLLKRMSFFEPFDVWVNEQVNFRYGTFIIRQGPHQFKIITIWFIQVILITITQWLYMCVFVYVCVCSLFNLYDMLLYDDNHFAYEKK